MCWGSPIEIVEKFNTTPSKLSSEYYDGVFVINLDKRPEKLLSAKKQLDQFGIKFMRFPAVYGWSLSQEKLDTVGVKFSLAMSAYRWACKLKTEKNSPKEFYILNPHCTGQRFVSPFVTHGAVGCFLSHLSIIKNAYDSGHNLIWILEDDFKIKENPAKIDQLIQKLDHSLGRDKWDILYTDSDIHDAPMYYAINDFTKPLQGLDLAWFWRPDQKMNKNLICSREFLGDHLIKIGSRMRTHSYLINRNGMKKILDFYENNGFYTPYDHELALIPELCKISLDFDLVTYEETTSDTRGPN